MRLLSFAIVFFCFSQISFTQEVGNMKGTWLPKTESKIRSNQANGRVDSFLKTLTGSLRPVICTYNRSVLATSTIIVNDQVKTNDALWSCSIAERAVAGQPDALDLELNFKLKEGRARSTGVAVAFDFTGWSVDNYVMVPGAAYNGNRFRVLPVKYPPYIYNPADKLLDMPVTVGNIIRLNQDKSPAKMEFLTGSCSTPMLSFYDPKAKRGFVMLTLQDTRYGNSGLIVEENAAQNRATFVLSAPGVREKMYKMLRFEPSGDNAAIWSAGDAVSLKLRVYNFKAENLPAFFDRIFSLRKDLTGIPEYRNIEPFSSINKVMLAHRDSTKWLETPEYGYISGRPWTNLIYNHFQAGYSMIYSYPYILNPTPERIRRVGRTLDLMQKMQGATGLSHAMFMDGEVVGSNWDEGRKNPHIVLIRRGGGEALYFGLQILEGMKLQGYGSNVKPEWETMFRKMADGLVNLWNNYGQFGQFVDVETGKMDINGSSAGVVCATGLTLASKYFSNPKYLEIAEKAAKYYYDRDLSKGYTGGSPVEEMQSPDDESAHNFCDMFTVLYEATGKKEYLAYANTAVANLATWAIPYDYKFPVGSRLHQFGTRTTGALFANVQNTHGTPCFYIHSGDFLLKLYRATSDKRYVELLKDVVHNVVQYVTTETNPFVPESKPGSMTERVQIGDWEGKENIGGELPAGDSNIAWETGTLLAINQNPGIYLRTDNGEMVVFDHVDAKIIKKDKTGITLKIHNPTHKDAVVSVFAENVNHAKIPMGSFAFLKWPKVEVKAGETKEYRIEIDRKILAH